MKKFLAALLLFASLHAYAQEGRFSVGIKGGLNISYIGNAGNSSISYWGMSSSTKASPKLLPHLGVYSEIKIDDMFSFQPELLFTMKGYHHRVAVSNGMSSTETIYDLSTSYLDVPLLMRVNIPKGFNIFGGPYLGFMLAANAKSKNTATYGSTVTSSESTSTSKEDFNTSEIGMYLGGGYQFTNGLNFGVRWCRSFTDLMDDGGTKNSNSAFQFSIGYRLKSF